MGTCTASEQLKRGKVLGTLEGVNSERVVGVIRIISVMRFDHAECRVNTEWRTR